MAQAADSNWRNDELSQRHVYEEMCGAFNSPNIKQKSERIWTVRVLVGGEV
jgi:hypothetical protein